MDKKQFCESMQKLADKSEEVCRYREIEGGVKDES